MVERFREKELMHGDPAHEVPVRTVGAKGEISTEKGLFTSVEVGVDVKRRCGDNFENKMIILLCGTFFTLFPVGL